MKKSDQHPQCGCSETLIWKFGNVKLNVYAFFKYLQVYNGKTATTVTTASHLDKCEKLYLNQEVKVLMSEENQYDRLDKSPQTGNFSKFASVPVFTKRIISSASTTSQLGLAS